MPIEGWQRVEALFEQAVELEPEERAAFLERHCANSPELRRELEELLDADAGVEVTWGLTLGFEETSALFEELEIPSYKIVRLLGQGGMGAVYLALRYDELFSGKPFAIKVLKLGRKRRGSQERFAAERRILSRLDHPYIARLYDGGRLADDTPYLVMDYVDGRPVDVYCREHRLSIDDRLRLFCKICAAVHYAHQNLVVHRDIKPGNILVSADGTPRLLDFGIAKLLDPEDPEDVEKSRQAALPNPLTPEYASPEQIRGAVVTTASDVYSLGVVLFELLTDRLPERSRPPDRGAGPDLASIAAGTLSAALAESALAELAHHRRLRPAQLRRRIKGDLDAIVQKALDPEPEKRYASAQALAEDVRRHLETLPVAALPPRWRYRLGKFSRRHRLRLAIVTSLAVAVTFLLAAFIQSQRLGRTTAVLRQLAGPESDPLMDEEFLDRVVFDIAHLDAPTRSRALLMEIVRRLYVPDEALFTQVLEALEKEIRPQAEAGEIAAVSLDLGRLLFTKGWFQQSEPILRASLAMAEEAHGAESPALSEHLEKLAETLAELGAFEEAVDLLRRGLELRRGALGERHPEFALSLHRLGSVLALMGVYHEAEIVHRQGLAILEEDDAVDPLVLADQLNSLSLVLMEQGKFEEAVELASQALEIRRERLGEKHHDALQSMGNLFTILARKGDAEVAIPVGLETVALVETTLGADHMRLAHPLLGLGALYQVRGQPDLCETYVRRAIALREAHLPETHWLIALARSTLGRCLTDLMRYEEAEKELRESLTGLLRARGPDDHWTVLARERLDHLLEVRGGSSP